MYYVIKTIITTGYGDISVDAYNEKLFVICLIMFGITIYSFLVRKIREIINNFQPN